ncbi:GNAT family N-acetyltransferase [Paenirhodobacter sp.]|uniref:GNAT family N-acetyltransferase n=1 Tax=Paenirhodobacter sp. TaxID=1965326 RepID=UPI003B41FA63
MLQDVTIQPGIAPAHRREAARLYWLAFGGKLGRVMGPEPKALAFIDRVMLADHAFVAIDAGGRVLGVIGCRTAQGAFVGGTHADLRAVYGRFGAWWRSHALAILAQDLPPDEIVIDGLAVVPDARGRGVGAALTNALILAARDRHYRAVHLDVIEGNTPARKLYDWLGFRPSGTRRSVLTRAIYGFGTCHTMTLPL